MRRIAALAVAALAIGVAGPPIPAVAADAAVCAAPSETLTGGGSAPISVAAGATLLLSAGTYTGAITALPTGGTLCIATDATLSPEETTTLAGTLIVQGTATFETAPTASAGFDLLNTGTTTLVMGLTSTGAISIDNRGTMEISATPVLGGGSNLTSSGNLSVHSTLSIGLGVRADFTGIVFIGGGFTVVGTLTTTATVTVGGPIIVEGPVSNGGVITGGAMVEVSVGGVLQNSCRVNAAIVTNRGEMHNSGIVTATNGATTNTGRLRQVPTGQMIGSDLANPGSVTGFGSFLFTGSTSVSGAFLGDSSLAPIVVEDTTPPTGRVFDDQSGEVVNAVAGTSPHNPPEYLPLGCGTLPESATDLIVTMTGPATVAPGAKVDYIVNVEVPTADADAETVTITVALDSRLTGVTASDSGTVAGGSVSWTLGTVAAGSSRQLTIRGTAPSSGTLVSTASGTTTTPDADETNNDGTRQDAKVTTVIVAPPPVNRPPVARDLTLHTTTDRSVVGQIVASDPDSGQQLTWSPVTQPSFGTALTQPVGVTEYLPALGFAGRDQYDIEVCDNGSPVLCDRARVTVEVAPVANVDLVVTRQSQPVDIDVRANDLGTVGPPRPTPPRSGTAQTQPDGQVRYTPRGTVVGIDQFQYTICSTQAPDVCVMSRAIIVILPPENNAPSADDITLRTFAGQLVEGTVPANDLDAGQTLTASIASPPAHGTADIVGSTTRTIYTPEALYTGRDSYPVTVCDDGLPTLCDTATVYVEVSPLARPDVASVGVAPATVAIDVLANDRGDSGAPSITTPPMHGTATVLGGELIEYTPAEGHAGPDALKYTICAPTAADLCATTTVHIIVAPPPNSPPLAEDISVTTTVDEPVADQAIGVDPDPGQTVTATLGTPPAHGTAMVSSDGNFDYTPEPGFAGEDSFTVTFCDDAFVSACSDPPATVSVDVFPLAQPDLVVGDVNGRLVDQPQENDQGTITLPELIGSATYGVASVAGTTVRYFPERDFAGLDSVPYRVCAQDVAQGELCADSTLYLAVRPHLIDDAASTLATTPVTFEVRDNDLGTLENPTILAQPEHGSASAAGTMRYAPTSTYTGYDVMAYRRCTPTSDLICGNAGVVVQVRPNLALDTAVTTESTPVTIDIAANDVGDANSAQVTRAPSHGTVSVLGNGRSAYQPNPGFVGIDTYTYERCSPNDTEVCSAADVIVRVLPAGPTVPPPPGPTNPPGAGPDTSHLPRTGTDPWPTLLFSLALIAAGLLGRQIARRTTRP